MQLSLCVSAGTTHLHTVHVVIIVLPPCTVVAAILLLLLTLFVCGIRRHIIIKGANVHTKMHIL